MIVFLHCPGEDESSNPALQVTDIPGLPGQKHQRCLCNEVGSENGHDDFPLYFYAGDISDPDVAEGFLASAARHFGRLDIVVVNAGVAQLHDFLTTPDTLIQEHIQVNICGAYYTVRAAGRIMKEQGTGGSFIGISSVSALTGSGELVHHTPTKAAVLNLMQSSAVALRPYGIRCNALLPGTIRTQLNVNDLAQNNKQKEVEQRTCLKRTGIPDDVCGTAGRTNVNIYLLTIRRLLERRCF